MSNQHFKCITLHVFLNPPPMKRLKQQEDLFLHILTDMFRNYFLKYVQILVSGRKASRVMERLLNLSKLGLGLGLTKKMCEDSIIFFSFWPVLDIVEYVIKSQNYAVIWSQKFIWSQTKLTIKLKKFFDKSFKASQC